MSQVLMHPLENKIVKFSPDVTPGVVTPLY